MANQLLLENRLSSLAKKHADLEKELKEVNNLLCTVGFPDGLRSLKQVAEDMIFAQNLNDPEEDDTQLNS